MSSSFISPSPARPLPFELRPLIQSVFASDSSPVHGSTILAPLAGSSRNTVIRSVDGHGQLLWVGSNDGRVKGLDVKATTPRPRVEHNRVASELAENPCTVDHPARPCSTSGRISVPSSHPVPDGPSTYQQDHIDTSCFQDYQVFRPANRCKSKPIEKLILVPMVGLAIILSEGTVTFHSITDLQPCPASSYPPIRGVSAVTLDEHTYGIDQSSEQPDVLMCVIKRKIISIYLLCMAGVRQVHEVAFASAAFQSLLRGSTLLLSDVQQYYLISLDQQPPDVIPLLPISQALSVDSSSTASSQATRLRPSMAAIPNSQEFILASHTGSTCLGIFISSTGEPSRGTLEWPSNPRSVAVDVNHVLALLFNGTIEIHLIETQELLHVITLPIGLEPRSLVSVKFGISLPGESYTSQLNTTLLSLETIPLPSLPSEPRVQSSCRLSAATQSRILLVGRNSLHALATRTFLAEVETLIEQNRWDDALAVVVQLLDSPQQGRSLAQLTTRSENLGLINQFNYVYQKISLYYLVEIRFDEAGDLWFKGYGDPRIFLKLFPRLSANRLCKNDKLQIFHGLIDVVCDITSAEELITAYLSRTDCPLRLSEPYDSSVFRETDLKDKLQDNAQQTLLKYLQRWRRDRLSKGGASDRDRHLDSIIDTALVQLLSERRQIDPEAYAALEQMTERPNSCVFSEIEDVLLENKCFCILYKMYLKQNDIAKALDIWAKLHDKRFLDEDFHEDLQQIVSVLLNYDDGKFVFKYALWMAPINHILAVKVLVQSNVSDDFDANATFQSLCEVSHEAAELYLEQMIPRESQKGLESSKRKNVESNDKVANQVADLRTKLVLGYLNKFKRLLSSPQEMTSLVLNFFRRLIEDFIALSEKEFNSQPSFVEYFLHFSTLGMSAQMPSHLVDAIRTRAKLMVCLDQSTFCNLNYDAPQIRGMLEEMGGSVEILALERAMVYSKIGLHRSALSLLAITLKDVRSAETYCLQSGRLLSLTQVSRLMTMGHIGNCEINGSLPALEIGPSSTHLLAILFDLLISAPNPSVHVKLLLFRHSSRIPLDASLGRLPSDWALDPILAPYITRSFRRSSHQTRESTIVKSIALGHKISLTISRRDHQARSLKFLSDRHPC